MSSTSIYNVFHHTTLGINCHLQSDASTCAGFPITPWNPLAPASASFGSSGEPAMYLDQSTGFLYVYAVRIDGGYTPGVACFDTNTAATCSGANGQPAGWTPLASPGDATANNTSGGGPINGVFYNGRFFAYNPFSGAAPSTGTSGKNALLCYDVAAHSACSGEPFAVNVGTTPGTNNETIPGNAETLIGSRLFIPSSWTTGTVLSCVDLSSATPGNCVGSTGANWPQSVSSLSSAAPIPYLSSTGAVTGVCYVATAWTCWDLFATGITTPAALTTAVMKASTWDGPPVVVGTRVFLANNAQSGGPKSDALDCFDFATLATCTAPGATQTANVDGTSSPNPGHFPLYYGIGLSYIYTVNADPLRPTCLWLNANGGSAQIQNVDALTGGSCASAPVRVYASSFVAPYQACLPTAFTSLSLSVSGTLQTSPPPTLSFTNANGVVIDGPYNFDVTTPASPTLDLTTLNYPTPIDLSTSGALPQFVLAMVPGGSGSIGTVTITATWSGSDLGQCSPSYAGPSPSTLAATGIGDNAVTLNGSVTNSGTDSVTPVAFCYQTTAFTSTNCTGTTVSPSQSVAASATTALNYALTNLSPGTTYYYELEATDSTNNNLVLYGGVQQFTTGPVATTEPVTAVATSSATLAGSLYNPSSDSFSSVGFCSQATAFSSGACTGTTTNAVLNGTQGSTSSYGLALTGLSTSTTYYYELIATGSSAPLYGGVQQFTTGPVATTTAATALSDQGATLNGKVFNPASDSITTSFCYQTTAFTMGQCTGTSGTGTPGSTTAHITPSSVTLTGLSTSTTYYYEIVATDATTSTTLYGGVQQFSTGPTATTTAATSVTRTAATLHGQVFNPASDSITTSFCVQASSFASGSCSGTTSNASGGGTIASVTPYGASLTGLTPGTTYYYEIVTIDATTSTTLYGGVQQFATGPVATTTAAIALSVQGAMLNGKVFNPASDSITTSFCYQTTAFTTGSCSGTTVNASGGGTIASLTPYGASLTGLTPGTTYYYEFEATDSTISTTLYGGVQQFSTSQPNGPAGPPNVPAGPPSAPTSPAGVRSGSSLGVTWGAPTTDGGSPITGYTCVLMSGFNLPTTFTVVTTSNQCEFTGLGNATSYLVSVYATNAVGNGPSVLVTPTTSSSGGGSTGSSGGTGSTGVRLHWTGVAKGGLAAAPRYVAHVSPGGQTCTTTATSCYFAGLRSSSGHTFHVTVAIEIVPFAENSAELNATMIPQANTLVSIIKRFHPAAVDLAGYTDAFAGAAYNVVLSAHRAQTVGSYVTDSLNRASVKVPTLHFAFRGKSRPVVSNASVARASMNRRVEVTFLIR